MQGPRPLRLRLSCHHSTQSHTCSHPHTCTQLTHARIHTNAHTQLTHMFIFTCAHSPHTPHIHTRSHTHRKLCVSTCSDQPNTPGKLAPASPAGPVGRALGVPSSGTTSSSPAASHTLLDRRRPSQEPGLSVGILPDNSDEDAAPKQVCVCYVVCVPHGVGNTRAIPS